MLNNKERLLHIVSIFVLIVPFIGYAQFDEISLIEGLSKGMNNTDNALLEDDEIQESEKTNQIEKNKRELIFEDENYGFSGGKSFASPPAEKYFDEPLKYFGYDFFQKSPSTYTQLKNIPIPSDYLIGPGDNFKIIIYGTRNRQFTVEVTRDGSIFIPEVGSISVSGQTFQEARANLENIISKQIVGAEIDVSMGELKLINIFILGEAYQPGMYTVSSLTSIINAIFISGGVDPSGSLRNIELKRNGVIISKMDLYDFLLRGDSTANERLMEGDVIFIPPVSKTVAINGQVRKPGIYELNETETISELIEFAGNLKPKADASSVEISSVDSRKNGFSLINIDLDLDTNKAKILNNGDVISVYPVFDNLSNAILIRGHAQKPGFYPWKKGMKVGSIFKSSNDLLEMTDLNYVLIKRKNTKSQRYDFLQLDLEKIFNSLDSEENITLFDQDEIILLPSLLSSELITTKLIQDKYILDEETNQIILEDERTSFAYLTRSLREKDLNNPDEISKAISNPNGAPVVLNENENIPQQDRFYEYSIYNYCFIPVELAKRIVKIKGFSKIESIPIKDLNKVTTPLQLETLLKTLEFENEIEQSSDQLNTEITNHCRRQLIDPLITIIKNQSSPSQRQKTIKTFGDLIYPGEYPHVANMDAEDAIAASGGFKNSSNVSVIEVNTRKIQNKEFVTTTRDFSVSSMRSTKHSIRPMDEVNVKELANNFRTAKVSGQVQFPGVYPILEGENLSDLIRRAGGLKDDGSFQGAIFTRESLRDSDKKRLNEAQSDLRRKILLASSQNQISGQQAGGNYAELVKLLTFDQEDSGVMGRLVINLESMMQGTTPDVLLQDADSIHIPSLQEMITVVGEVNGSNAHQYSPQLGVLDYISLSGGLTSFGDTSSIYVVKSNGLTVSYSDVKGGFFRSSSQLEAGDTIIVPFEADRFGQLRATTEITQIIYQMALAAAAVNSF
tara:strand:- start:9423 stop:12305 length:2883 start_codon:yes stop_codon:yes gene_type:complete